jgi:predicted metal-binding membrane protein
MSHTTSLAAQFEPGIFGWAGVRSERNSRRAFAGGMVMLFVASAAVTGIWCNSMWASGGMPMPGGWTMSMAWMRMPGQAWPAAVASFLGMWTVMMVAMMLPSLAPALDRYRRHAEPIPGMSRGWHTSLVGLGYFSVWALLGLAVFPLGVVLARAEMQQAALARVVPIATGLIVLLAGALQFTRWKAHHLVLCREALGQGPILTATTFTPWRLGLGLGLHCCLSCANLTAILLVIGVMDLRVMAAVTAAITAERLAPARGRTVHVIGATAVSLGWILVIKAFAFA